MPMNYGIQKEQEKFVVTENVNCLDLLIGFGKMENILFFIRYL